MNRIYSTPINAFHEATADEPHDLDEYEIVYDNFINEYQYIVSDSLSFPSMPPISLKNETIVVGFGRRLHPIYKMVTEHNGIDLACPTGTLVQALSNGVVKIIKESFSGLGKSVVIEHSNGVESIYGHLSEINVKEGQKLYTQDRIGLSGNSGLSTRPHIHYEIKIDGNYINPLLTFSNTLSKEFLITILHGQFDNYLGFQSFD